MRMKRSGEEGTFIWLAGYVVVLLKGVERECSVESVEREDQW